jgi:hypothetical protein
MKSLNDIKTDMSELYEAVKNGSVDLKVASELANISGKFLKAEQLQLAREVFLSNRAEPPVIINRKP